VHLSPLFPTLNKLLIQCHYLHCALVIFLKESGGFWRMLHLHEDCLYWYILGVILAGWGVILFLGAMYEQFYFLQSM
jgi:hypothetical protein